jgi:hypothetical protein
MSAVFWQRTDAQKGVPTAHKGFNVGTESIHVSVFNSQIQTSIMTHYLLTTQQVKL